MWKESFKEMFRFLFDNPVIFLIILGNYALVFLLGPLLGFVGFFFIALFYLVGLHGDINNLWYSIKRLVRWAFFVALAEYILFFGISLLSYLVYKALGLNLYSAPGKTLLFTVIWSFLLTFLVHSIYILLFASTDFRTFKENLRKISLLFKGNFVSVFLLLWGFMFITLLAGLVQFIHMTIGLYAVVASFWLTYYTFLGVKLFKKLLLNEEV